MKVTIRIWVKDRESTTVDGHGVRADVAHTQDIAAPELYNTMRELEKRFPAPRYSIRTRQLNPLGL